MSFSEGLTTPAPVPSPIESNNEQNESNPQPANFTSLAESKLADSSVPCEEEAGEPRGLAPGLDGPRGVDFLVEKAKKDHAAYSASTQAYLGASKLADDSAAPSEEEDDIIGPPGRGGPRGPKGVDFLIEKVKKDHAASKQAELEDDIIGPPGRGGPRGPRGVDFLIEKVKKDHAASKQAELAASIHKASKLTRDPIATRGVYIDALEAKMIKEHAANKKALEDLKQKQDPRGPRGVDALVAKMKKQRGERTDKNSSTTE